MHYNYFQNTHLAVAPLESETATDTSDARWNWWGDGSGPYQSRFNVRGRGDTVVGTHVRFSPWLTDTFTVDTNLTPELRAGLLPEKAAVEVFPNPFNTRTRLKLTVIKSGTYSVDLFNLLGQKTAQVWLGSVTENQEIPLDADALKLASGIYWVRVSDVENHEVAAVKIVLMK
jgi:hypothetical protein